MQGFIVTQSWLVLLPPLFVLCVAYFTHNILISLLVGVTSAGLIATNFSIIDTGLLIFSYIKKNITDPDVLCMIGFAFMLGATIALINYTGGACALGKLITKKLKEARDAESASLFLSLLLCVDDYLSSLTVGCLMQPLTDKFKIPRTKLAFLINTMASPLVVLVPVSTWIGIIVKQLGSSGLSIEYAKTFREHIHFPGGVVDIAQKIVIHSDPFYTYLKSVPFLFYSFIVIIGTWFIVRRRISYGPMHTHERIAQQTGNLYGGQAPRFCAMQMQTTGTTHLSDFFVPIVTLVFATIAGLPISGYLYGAQTFWESFKFAKIFPVMLIASILAFVFGCILALIRKKIAIKHVIFFEWSGIQLMYQSAIIIFSAIIFSDLLDKKLLTGVYIAKLIIPYVSLHWVPLITFLITSIVALSTGSSWGTIFIMTPISIQLVGTLSGLPSPIALPDIYILLPTIGAVISGSIAGAQISPIADPVTISSTSAGCYQIDHVRTQIPYVLPAILGACASFTAAGFLKINGPTITALVCLAIGIAVSLSIISILNILARKTQKS